MGTLKGVGAATGAGVVSPCRRGLERLGAGAVGRETFVEATPLVDGTGRLASTQLVSGKIEDFFIRLRVFSKSLGTHAAALLLSYVAIGSPLSVVTSERVVPHKFKSLHGVGLHCEILPER